MNQPSDKLPLNVKLAHRSGFTIVELLVAMALIVFMMSIMSQAFVIATTAMSGLKKVTDLVDKVRPAMAILERDLGAYHFDGSRRLSDANFWESGPPTAGYFSVWQDKPNSNHYPFGATTASEFNNGSANPTYGEGIKDGVAFAMASADANHMLAFTVKANPALSSTSISPDDYFGLNLPYAGIGTDIGLNNKITGTITTTCLGNDLAGVYFPSGVPSKLSGNKFLNFKNQSLSNNGQPLSYSGQPLSYNGLVNSQRLEKLLTDWMEVAYFLRDSGRKTDNGVPICTLYRQHRMLLPEANLVNNATLYLNDDPGSTLTNPLQALYNISCFTNNDLGRPPLPTDTSGNFWYADSKWPLKFNTPETLTIPWRRLGKRPYNHAGVSINSTAPDYLDPFFIPYNVQNPNHPGAYSDVFLNNVLSFEVKLMVDNSMNFKSLWETAGVDARDISNSAILKAPDRYSGPDNVNNPPLGEVIPNQTYQYTTTIPSYLAFSGITSLNRNYGFTRPLTDSYISNPFWKRTATLDRVAFDTWSRNSDFDSSVDAWSTNNLTDPAIVLETNDSAVYPKPQGRNASLLPYRSRTLSPTDALAINYDPGVFDFNPSGSVANVVLDGAAYPPIDDDRDPLTPNISIPEKGQLKHPFYGPITSPARLNELLTSHQNYKWMPNPGPGADRIPIWQNSFVDGIKVDGGIPSKQTIYFPKGPRIYAIQISIRIYDENTKTTKEFKLIQRL
ncbi:MAG: prepilin-type N-terminal cleavage/methylation domain-containing protein [Planctomycetota bacterium]|nr:prepilin-type N-terminal cleavage/methylation domain-containing protein [Planctomycetota bacterium]